MLLSVAGGGNKRRCAFVFGSQQRRETAVCPLYAECPWACRFPGAGDTAYGPSFLYICSVLPIYGKPGRYILAGKASKVTVFGDGVI